MMRLSFLAEPANAVLVGPNGVGKSTIARHIAHQAVLAGHSVLFTNASCVVSLVDRLVHHAEIIPIERIVWNTYRLEIQEAYRRDREQYRLPGQPPEPRRPVRRPYPLLNHPPVEHPGGLAAPFLRPTTRAHLAAN
jgi:hypothetical protein